MGAAKTALVIGDLKAQGKSLGGALSAMGVRTALRPLSEYSVGEISLAVIDAEESLGSVDALYYCAGLPLQPSESPVLLDIDEQDWDAAMNGLLKGFFLSCKCALPYLLGSDEPRVYLLLPEVAQSEDLGIHARVALSASRTLLDCMSRELSVYGVVLESIKMSGGWLESILNPAPSAG